jgi:hypothetical protein
VSSEEAHAALGQLRYPAFGRPEGVVTLASHVEELVEALVRVVVIAEAGAEDHSGVEERLVGGLELARHLRGGVRPVDVVADHDHEIEGELVVDGGHLRRHLVLLSRAPNAHTRMDGPSSGSVRGGGAPGALAAGAAAGQRASQETTRRRLIVAWLMGLA